MVLQKVLFVDDEEAVLNGLRRTLHGEFDLHVAIGGEAGLTAVRNKGPFAVVVSDMRMPGINGAIFLAKVRALASHTTRILLTGYSDIEAAGEAINKGQIYQYLNKPCSREDLCLSINLGIERYKEALAEKELLQGTLIGSMRALSEVLSVVDPVSFERSTRISRFVRDLIMMNVLERPWQVEAAAMLSQIGCLMEQNNPLRAARHGIEVAAETMMSYAKHPEVASNLLSHIPRLEGVAWIIRNQNGLGSESPPAGVDLRQMEELELGAEMLRMAITFDTLWLQGLSHDEIMLRIATVNKSFPPKLLQCLNSIRSPEKLWTPKLLSVSMLNEGMIIDEDIINKANVLLVGRGQPISKALITRLCQYREAGIIGLIRVLVTKSPEEISATALK